jgi:hypothetical protein
MMRNFWITVARFIAIILAIAFVLTAITAVILVNIDRQLLRADTYKNALATQNIYTRLPRIIAEELVTSINYNPCQVNPLTCEGASTQFANCAKTALGDTRYQTLTSNGAQISDADKQLIQACLDQFGPSLLPQQTGENAPGGPPPFLKSLGESNIETIIATLLPADQMQAMTEDTLNQIFDYLNSQRGTATINLVSLKQRISGMAGLDVILQIIRAQPSCTVSLVEQMVASLLNGQMDILLCNPPDYVLGMLTGTIQSQLAVYANHIPDQVVILSSIPGGNQINQGPLGGRNPTSVVRLVRIIMRLSPIVPLVFLMLITLLVVRSLKGWLRWWSIPLFFTGLFTIVLAIFASVFFEQTWSVIIVNRIPPYISSDLVTLGHDLLQAILQPFLKSLVISGLIIGVIGLGIWIGSIFIKQKNKAGSGTESLPSTT